MLNHEQNAPEVASGSFAPVTQAKDANFFPLHDDILEDTVDQVCALLIGTLPRPDRLARRAALRQELDTLVAAHGELDANPERAVSEALAHFARLHPAPALRVTQGHVQQNVTQQTASTRAPSSARPATLFALGLLVPVYMAHILNWTEALRGPLRLSETGLYRLELFAAPLLAGLLVGLLTRREAVRGVFTACAIIALYAVALPSILMALAYTKLLPFENSSVYSWLVANPMAGYAGLIVWPLLGCAGAFAGAALRRKAKSLPQMKRIKRIHADAIQK